MDDTQVDMREQLTALRRRWRIVASTLLFVILATMGLVRFATPEYQATSVLVIEPVQAVASNSGVVMDPDEVATQVTVLTSFAVADRVKDAVGLDESPTVLLESVVVEPREDTRTVDIAVTRGDALEAAKIANAFAEEYIAYRQDEVVDRLSDLRARYTTQLTEISEELDAINEEIREFVDTDDGPTRVSLRAERDSLLIQRADVSTQLATLTYGTDTTSPGGLITLRAEPSATPSSPNMVRSLVVGMTLGLLLGMALALIRDRADDVVRDEARLRPLLEGQPVLGRIPSAREANQGRVVTLIAPHAHVSEAYRALSVSARFLVAATPRRSGLHATRGRVLLVTSASPGEGKTSVAANLAVAASQAGLQVVLVDADLRRPALGAQFGLHGVAGLTDALIEGGVRLEHLLSIGVERLRVLAGDAAPPNPAALLATPTTETILQRLCAESDLVIVDSAPLLAAADTLELVPHADLVLLVTRFRHSRYRAVAAALERLSHVGRRPDGVVLNDVPVTEAQYGYGYARGQREDFQQDRKHPSSLTGTNEDDTWPQNVPAEARR